LVEEGGALALLKGDWKYIEPHKRLKVFKLVNIASGYEEEPQLYNLKNDVSEKNNLASK
jgi:arylsulfatase A